MITVKYQYKNREYISTLEFTTFDEYSQWLSAMGDQIELKGFERK